jgi:hypothetical protein
MEWRPYRRRLDDAGNRRGFRDRDITDVFPEEQPRGLGDAVHRERTALTQVDLVQVQLENLVFRGLALEDERHELLEQFAFRRLLRSEEEVLHQLLCERAAADQVPFFAAKVRHDRAEDANRVDAQVLVEASILDGDDCLHHSSRNGGQRNLPALLPRGAHEGREQRRIEHDSVGRAAAGLDAAHAGGRGRHGRRLPGARLLERDANDLALVIAAARHERDRASRHGELASLFDTGALRVAEVVEPIDELSGTQPLTLAQRQRAREHARQHAVPLTVKARFDLT